MITVLFSLSAKAEVEASARHEFDFAGDEIFLKIKDRLNVQEQLLYSGAALFSASENVTRQEWQAFVRTLRLSQQIPGIQGIGYSVLIPAGQLQAHIQQVRGEGFPDYTVWPAGEREIYSAIVYLEPFSGRNLSAFGYDMYSEPVRRAAMEMARDQNTAALSGKVVLVQETTEDIQPGTLLYVPVYASGLPVDTLEQRRAALLGWVYSPYRMKDLLSGILGGWDLQSGRTIHLEIYDGDQVTPAALLYDNRPAGAEDLAKSEVFTRLLPLDFGGRRWTVRFAHTGEMAATLDYSPAWLLLWSGTIINLLLGGLVFSLLVTRTGARRMAARLTADLGESEEKYRTIFNNEIYAICIFDIQTQRLLDVNEAFIQLYGYSRAELLGGMTIADISAEAEVSTESINQTASESTIFIPLRRHRKKDGTLIEVEIVGGPYRLKGEQVMYGLIHNISSRIRAEKALQDRELHYRALVDGIPGIVYIFSNRGGGTYYSAHALDLLGYSANEMLAQPFLWHDSIHPEDVARIENAIAATAAGESFQVEYRIRGRDGAWHWFDDRSILIYSLGEEIIVEGLALDITASKQNTESLQASLAEKDALLREVHHRVKNNLASIIGLIGLQQGRQTDLLIREAFNGLGSRIQAMALVHEMLYRSETLTRIDLQVYLEQLLSHLRSLYQTAGMIQMTVAAQGVYMSLDTAIPCGLIVSEMVTNSFKYAFPAGRPRPGEQLCKISVEAAWDGKTYWLAVRDNGIGLPEGWDWKNAPTLGLRLIWMLSQHQLGAAAQMDSSAGISFEMRFKPPK